MAENIILLIIDGTEVKAREGQTILEAALAADIYIPHLCYHPVLASFEEILPIEVCYRGKKDFPNDPEADGYTGCGLCVVKISGRDKPVQSCVIPVEMGMDVVSSSPDIVDIRRDNLASVFSRHPHACLTCAQKEGCSLTQCSTNVPEEERCCPLFDVCELRAVAEYVGIKEDIPRFVPQSLYKEEDGPLFIRDYNLCVGCLRCVRACEKIIGAKALGYVTAGGIATVGTTGPSLEESGCRFCGACAEVCPTGAIRDKDLKPGERKDALVPCAARCPVGMDVPVYVSSIRQQRYAEASKIIRNRVPLAATLGYICSHPCEEECRRGKFNKPVAVCDLKRFALEITDAEQGARRARGAGGAKVAVIGSGPAGLVASYFLAKLGHAVTIYEAQAEPGGMLRYAIPDYRLPRSVLMKEIETVQRMGVDILTGTPVDRDMFLQDFQRNEWDALFLATGAPESKKIDVEGLSAEGVHLGLEFLKKAKEYDSGQLSGKVVVIGGGNVAVDVAMTALRLGASEVQMACLEKREEMPAFSWEIQEAEEEGIRIHAGWGPRRIIAESGRAAGVELHRCMSVFDEKGCFCPTFDAGERKRLDADAVILAVGQKTDFSYLPDDSGIRFTDDQTIQVYPDTLETGVPGIFAGGEAAFGPGSAVDAMASGRIAAAAIDKFLGGQGILGEPSGLPGIENFWMDREKDFIARDRIPMTCFPPPERCHSFGLIKIGYSEEEALQESSRCLRCDVRLQIPPVHMPPEKWIDFNAENIGRVPESGGAFQLLDKEKKTLFIAGAPNLRECLHRQLDEVTGARYFIYEKDPMYTKRESELIQQYLQRHGQLPPGNEEIDDLF